jgi:hypothetical protein
VQVHEHADDLRAEGFTPMAVGFSPPGGLAALVTHLAWPWPFCSDEDRLLYGRLGIGRAALRDVFNAGTRAIYKEAAVKGEGLKAPVEDIRQLGGDVLVVDGVARRLARPASPDDRPSVAALLAAAREL